MSIEVKLLLVYLALIGAWNFLNAIARACYSVRQAPNYYHSIILGFVAFVCILRNYP